MSYVNKDELLKQTDGGLKIIVSYYPEAADAIHRKDKKFKVRAEKTASASIKLMEDGNWLVTDFGGDSKPRNAIGVCMLEEGVTFKEAVNILAARFGVEGVDNSKLLRPEIEKRKAKAKEVPGEMYWKDKKSFTEAELKELGPYVTPEVCERYGLLSLEAYWYVKDGEATLYKSTEHYPIFLFERKTWRKLYQPRNLDKGFRFRHGGERPKDYVFGLDVCQKAYDKLNADFDVDSDEAEARKMKKLPEIIICSGDRDALNVAGMGHNVVWFNSETAELTWEQFRKLSTLADKVMQLPDIDKTGIREGHKRAMRFLDLYTIHLPKELLLRSDFRGNPCKDLRDYLRFYKPSHFKGLVETAMPYRMWDETYKPKKEGNGYYVEYKLNLAHTYNFLQANGFYRLPLPNQKTGYTYIHLKNNIVSEVSDIEVKSFINEFLEERHAKIDLRNLFYRSQNQLSERSLSNLRKREIDFTDYTKHSQFLFFKNETWEVSAKGIERHKPGIVERFVWEDEVMDHNVKLLDPPFKIIRDEDGEYSIQILRKDCLFFQYLINTSRIHWQKVDERGIKITEEEQREEDMHLINKIYALGYLLHRLKDPNRPWCVFAMDNKISETGESHGGSGKSIALNSIGYFMKSEVLKGRDPKLTDNTHIYENITEHTDFLLIDDANQYLNFDFFFSEITGSMRVNPKFGRQFTIPFESVPKMAITSNFTLRNLDPSTERRLLYMVFSDYYHFNKDGEYSDTRTPYDDFGKKLFDDFTPEEWNEYINTMAACLNAYLQFPKIDPPMYNVQQRNLRTEMTEIFKDWADLYFSTESGRLDVEASKEEAFESFKNTGAKNWTPTRFKKSLKAWCRYYGYIYTPPSVCTDKDRIIRNINGKTSEMVYIQTSVTKKTATDGISNTLEDQDDSIDAF